MGPFSNDPNPTGSPPASSGWAGQPRASQGTPGWVGQSASQPLGVKPDLLDRGSAWPALRLIARTLKIIAWVQLVFGVISALGMGTALGALIGGISFLLVIYLLIITAIGFMLTYGSAEIILVFLAIEKNTRKNE